MEIHKFTLGSWRNLLPLPVSNAQNFYLICSLLIFFQSVLLFLSRNLIVFVELISFYHQKFLYWKGSESFSVTCCFCRNFNNAQHIFDDHNSKFTINWKLLRPRKTVPSPEYLWDEYLIYSSEYLILTNQYAVVIRVGNITPWFFREIKTWFITSIGTILRCK